MNKMEGKVMKWGLLHHVLETSMVLGFPGTIVVPVGESPSENGGGK